MVDPTHVVYQEIEHAVASQGVKLVSLEPQPGATYLATYQRTDSGDERTYLAKVSMTSGPTATVNAIADDARRR